MSAALLQPKSGPVWHYEAGQDRQVFDSGALRPRDRFDAWVDRLSHTYDIAQPEPAADHRVRSEVWSLGPIAASEVDCAPQITTVRHGRGRLTDPEALHLRLYHGGRSRGVIGGKPVETRAGEIHAFDMSRPFVNVTDGAHFTAIFIPHRLVGYDPSRHGPHGMLPAGDGTGRLLAAGIRVLASTRPDLADEEKAATVEGFLALVRALVLGNMETPGARRAVEETRRAEIRAFIERELTDPNLSIEMVCAAFGASRATIYRDFAEEGGIRHYVRTRRLALARDMLAAAAPERGAVTRIATRCGFTDIAHFTRAFRAAFGEAPGDVIGRETDCQAD